MNQSKQIPIPESDHDEMIKYAQESNEFLTAALSEPYRQWEEQWKRYEGNTPDPRDPKREMWRSHLPGAQANYNIEAKVAQELEIVMTPDPPVQTRPTSELSEERASDVDKLLSHTLYTNYARRTLAKCFRAKAIQGTDFIKTTFKYTSRTVMVRATKKEFLELGKRIEEAQALNLGTPPDWMTDPEGFEDWRDLVNKAKPHLAIPPVPQEGERERVLFWGPAFERVSGYNILFDPLIDDWDSQPMIIHKMVKPKAWLMDRTGDGPMTRHPFDPVAVEDAMSAWDASTLDQEVKARVLRIGTNAGMSPHNREPVMLWECYRPGCEYPFQMILNESKVINKNPKAMPFEHGQIPISPIRNNEQPGTVLGMSDLRPARALFEEHDTLRGLRLDSAKLHTIPAFRIPNTAGISDVQRQIYPGAFVVSSQPIEPLLEGDVKNSAFAEITDIKAEIDRSMRSSEGLRGATVTINRVPASTDASRLNQAIMGIKSGIGQFEDDFRNVIKQTLSLWLQFGFNDKMRPAGLLTNPLATLDQDTLMAALDSTFQIVGATEADNRELQAQQLIQFFDKFQNVTTMAEKRAGMEEVAKVLKLRGISKIVSPAGTDRQVKMDELMAEQQMMQLGGAMQQMQAQAAAAGAPPEVGAPPPMAPPGNGAPPEAAPMEAPVQ